MLLDSTKRSLQQKSAPPSHVEPTPTKNPPTKIKVEPPPPPHNDAPPIDNKLPYYFGRYPQQEIQSIVECYPDGFGYQKETNKIIELKAGSSLQIQRYAEMLHNRLRGNLTLAVAPPHQQAQTQSGILRVAQYLIAKYNYGDATDLIQRKHTVAQRISQDHRRTFQCQLDSLQANQPERFTDSYVVILDDLTHTGFTLTACSTLLKQSGLKHIAMLSIGEVITPPK
ncbi:phosphoribosyltransferase [Rubritalea tangerina]|uniref:Phosphoribosyltransferase n=1 Tax=Rubritalea tangerina TaxID=430798 RepID=A0ABW4ZDV1_9BACT